MPTYKFHNKDTGEVWEEFMGISAADDMLKDNPHIERLVNGAPGLVGGTGDRTKPDGGFKEVLSKISEANPTSALANTYGAKDAKSVAVRNLVQKHRPKT
tara:strand:+ start:132 stop:431 length:300 start_codon:yes stop_codon:yes gene_type:complete